MAELKKRCSQRAFDGSYLTVCEVPAPTCIAVSSDADIPSNDALTLYFELKRNGGKILRPCTYHCIPVQIWPEGFKTFLCLTQLSMKFYLLINSRVLISTIVCQP